MSKRIQVSSKKTHLVHKQKQGQQIGRKVEKEGICEFTKAENSKNYAEDAQMSNGENLYRNLTDAESSLLSERCLHTDFYEVFSEKQDLGSDDHKSNIKTTKKYQMTEVYLPSDGDSFIGSSRNHSPHLEDIHAPNLQNDNLNLMDKIPSIFSETCRYTDFTRGLIKNLYDEKRENILSCESATVKCLDQICVTQPICEMEQEFSVVSEDAQADIKEWIIDLPESVNTVQNLCFRHFPARTVIGSSSSIHSEPCPRTNHIELDFKNHNRTHSCGSLDSIHIDILNDINLGDLDALF
jgi:hypothetical protein